MVVALGGVNWAIQGINDYIQQKHVKEQMDKLQPTIDDTLNNNPTLGVLVAAHFQKEEKMGAENETPLDNVSVFQYISYEYGITEELARKRMSSTPEIGPAGYGKPFSQTKWIPPKQPPSAEDLPTPFQRSALATFVPGLEELVAVKFSMAAGFDDKMRSRISLSVPKGFEARFIIMWPPDEVRYRWDGTGALRAFPWPTCRRARLSIKNKSSIMCAPSN